MKVGVFHFIVCMLGPVVFEAFGSAEFVSILVGRAPWVVEPDEWFALVISPRAEWDCPWLVSIRFLGVESRKCSYSDWGV